MDNKQFFNALSGLGEFRCERDLRRFNNKKPKTKSEKHSMAATLSHFGHCHSFRHHFCDFVPHKDNGRVILYYWKVVERDGQRIRVRGGHPLKTAGRGRPPVKHLKRKR